MSIETNALPLSQAATRVRVRRVATAARHCSWPESYLQRVLASSNFHRLIEYGRSAASGSADTPAYGANTDAAAANIRTGGGVNRPRDRGINRYSYSPRNVAAPRRLLTSSQQGARIFPLQTTPSLHVSVARLRNSLPVDVQSAPSLTTFRQKLKSHLFRSAIVSRHCCYDLYACVQKTGSV